MEHTAEFVTWCHEQLDKKDEYLDRLEDYINTYPDVLGRKEGNILVPRRLVDAGTEMDVKIVSFSSENAAMVITYDHLGKKRRAETVALELQKENECFTQIVKVRFDVPGNTKIELWVNGERIVRQIAVLEKGYMAVIPWVGNNKPFLDEELHKFDIAGDYWMSNPKVEENPEKQIERFLPYLKNNHKYGDRTACFVNGQTLVGECETDSLFELDESVQERGLTQLHRQMELLGFDKMELLASYTPDAVTIEILERLGIKGLTSLCAWQNWRDGGWKINHCGVSNQPYYPAKDDFRRAGENRNLMCFTMGNASCNRNYSIMALDGCPTNVCPGERYLSHRVVHHQIQRFYDAFDGYLADAVQNEELLTVTIALESFNKNMDWNAANELAIRYMVKKAGEEKIVFTSAADVADYHIDRKLKVQKAYFFQPDYYYGYHNGALPGHVADRIEAVTPQYLAVVRRGSMLPMYFYDYTAQWHNDGFEEIERNEFGLVNPDEHDPAECVPKQVYRGDVELSYEIEKDTVFIHVNCGSEKENMVTGIFDFPFEEDCVLIADKADVVMKKIKDLRNENIHLFMELGKLVQGSSDIVIRVKGKKKTPEKSEYICKELGAMWFKDHVYLRSVDKDQAIEVEMAAPQEAYLILQSGKRIRSVNGQLKFIVNSCWGDEAPILYGYCRESLEEAMRDAKVTKAGKSACSRWSW